MEIPVGVREPKSINPNILLLYGIPKSGKTKICSQLKDHLILELEACGADFVSGRIMEINKPSDFNKALELIEKSETLVCEHLIIDTCTKLDEWSEIVGTYEYMQKPQGAKFNRVGEVKGGQMIYHTNKEFETIHSLPNGNGYQFSRNVMTDWYDRLLNLIINKKVKYIILIAHVKDKVIETKSGNIVDAIDINLTGKVKGIYASRVDTIGYFYRKGKQGILNFNNDYKVICGGRCPHLTGEVVISEKQDNNDILTFWDKVYLNN